MVRTGKHVEHIRRMPSHSSGSTTEKACRTAFKGGQPRFPAHVALLRSARSGGHGCFCLHVSAAFMSMRTMVALVERISAVPGA